MFQRSGAVSRSQFLSTPSARRATCPSCQRLESFKISIHALREEGDPRAGRTARWILYFYPRPPRGGRPRASRAAGRGERISIHALREEGDCDNWEELEGAI